jgi:hypothetical protein
MIQSLKRPLQESNCPTAPGFGAMILDEEQGTKKAADQSVLKYVRFAAF